MRAGRGGRGKAGARVTGAILIARGVTVTVLSIYAVLVSFKVGICALGVMLSQVSI